jgi:hypothetical protein
MTRKLGARPLRDSVRRPPTLNTALRVYLETGELPKDGNDTDFFDAFALTSSWARTELYGVWLVHGADVVREWTARRPGTRPAAWWLFSAPRWRREDLPARQRRLGDVFLRWLPEPRRRLGGKGTLHYEALNYVPELPFGLPTGFVTAWDCRYYTGFARDIHGKPIGTEFRGHRFDAEAYDPRDPPTFESEAAYLARHNLLSDDERQRLSPADYEPVTIVYNDDPDAA